MNDPFIQTTNLSDTFQALRNRDPLKVQRQTIEEHPDYKRVPRANYAPIAVVNTGQWGGGMTRMASASTGGTIYGQPGFFSPIHTNINWQIPSKRLEQYQWARFFYENEPKVGSAIDFYCFVSDTPILMADGKQKTISSINCGDFVRSHDGTVNMVEKVNKRLASDEEVLKIKISGVGGTYSPNMKVTPGHMILTDRNGKIDFVPASSLKIGEYLLTPCGYGSNNKNIISDDLAWLIGIYAAEGNTIPYVHTSKTGVDRRDYKGVQFTIHIDEESLEQEIKKKIKIVYGDVNIITRINEEDHTRTLFVFQTMIGDDLCGACPGATISRSKRFSPWVMNLSISNLINILSGFFSGDGCYNHSNGFQGVGNSKSLLEQIANICDMIGIEYSYTVTRISNKDQKIAHNVRIPRRSCSIFDGSPKYYDFNNLNLKKSNNIPFFVKGNYIYRKILEIDSYFYSGDLYDLTINNCHSYVANRVSVHNSQYPMSDWEHECRNRKVKVYFDRLKQRLKLNKWCRLISHEVHLLGDCFPFVEVDCPHCFVKDTMILTENGHKPIQNINVDDKVLTIEGTYEDVIGTMSFKYEGKMVQIVPQSIPSIKSTADHKHYIIKPEYRSDGERVKHNFDWSNVIETEAINIKKGDYVACPFDNVLKSDIEKIHFDGSQYRFKNKDLGKSIDILLDDDFSRLMGWYVAEGSTDSNRSFSFTLSLDEQKYAEQISFWMEKYLQQGSKIEPRYVGNVIIVYGYSREVSAWLDEYCGHGAKNKKIPSFIMRASKSVKKAFLEAYLKGDGAARKSRNENTLTTVSRTLCYDLIALLADIGYSCYVCEKEECIDNLGIHRCHSYSINYRIEDKRKNGQGTHKTSNKIFFKVKDVSVSNEKLIVYNFTVDKHHNYIANFCHTRNCGGSGKLGTDICEHEGGTVRRVIILNPDYVEVITGSVSPEPMIALRPDEELINMVQRKTPGYEKLSMEVIKLISAGQPIRLDNRNVAHLKYGECGYQKYGVGMVRRLFPILSYKTKLMVAQWIVAERLIVPIKIVKVGSDERPAGPADIAAVQAQLAATANDPNLTIVTHHAFDLDWVGACYSSDTEVLTENGWKNYADVSKNYDERIATYNVDLNCIEYQIPQEYHEYEYNGEMIHFNDNLEFDTLVTPNHDMLVSEDGYKWNKEKAEKVKGNVFFKNEESIEDKETNDFYIKKEYISKIDYHDKVWCFTVSNGFFVTRRNDKIAIHGNSGKILTLSNEFEFINQEILDGMMINNALLNGEGPNFCLSACSRILCDSGLKYKDELDIEKDLIATFNKETGAIEYQKAIRKYEYDYNSIDGDDPPLKHFKTNRIDMLVTPNHRMLWCRRKLTTNSGDGGQKVNGQKEGFGEWEISEASSVKKRGRFRACVDKWIETTEDDCKYCGIETQEFLKIVGWYISEGNRTFNGMKSKVVGVNISQSESANNITYNKMKKVFSSSGLIFSETKRRDAFLFNRSKNEQLVSYLVNECGGYSNTKCIPKNLKNMSCKNLRILLEALVDGDGSERPATKKKSTNKKYYSYTTVSRQLRDDVIEILFKLGYSPRFNTIKFDSDKLQIQYTISWGETDLGKFPVLDSRKWDNNKKSCNCTSEQVIFDEDYVGKVWCVEVPNHFIVTERNGLFGIHGNSSAAVGIEAMIQRLKTFRQEISEWLLESIYIPEALRQGFVEKNPETGEDEVIIPKIKWNSMHLRDQQQDKTFAIQLYEKGLLSAQTVLELFDYDPDQEIERKRYDSLQMIALGQGMGQPAGGMGGGGLGGMPLGGGDMGGGGEPPIGGPGGGDMGGPGTPMGTPPSPTGGGVGGPPISKASSISAVEADPGQFGGMVLKKKTRDRIERERQRAQQEQQRQQIQQQKAQNAAATGQGQMRDEKGRIVFTGVERQLIPLLKQAQKDGLLSGLVIYPQHRITSGEEEYVIDFAIPQLKIGLEADGEVFHSSPKQEMHDKERDMLLAQQGWTIARFSDRDIEHNPQQVVQEVIRLVMQKQLAIKNTAAQAQKEQQKDPHNPQS